MNTFTSIFVAALCVTAAVASPVASEDKQQMRTIYNSGGGIYLGLNSTTLTLGVVILAALVIGLLFALQSGLLDDVASTGYQQRYDNYYHQQGHEQYRTKRSYNESKSI